MKIVEAEEVYQSLEMGKCMELVKDALVKLSNGEAFQPPRSVNVLPRGDVFGFMPAYLGPGTCYGGKCVTACPRNAGTGLPSHSGYVMIFEEEHGRVLGLADGGAVTELRTGAVSGIATDLLARENSRTLAFIGTGAQARSHLAAISLVRQIEKVFVFNPHKEGAEKFADEMQIKYQIPVIVCNSIEEAVREADIVCTVTPVKEAYLKKEWIRPGTHINAVGAFTPTTREVTSELVAASSFFADCIESCRKECGEYLIPLHEGLITEDHIKGDLGQLLRGVVRGRQSEGEITLFDALGLAVEDVACGLYLVNN